MLTDFSCSLAYIGRNIWTTKANLYVHTGDNGDGLTYAAIGGILIRDLITGKKNEWESVYAPNRQLSASQVCILVTIEFI